MMLVSSLVRRVETRDARGNDAELEEDNASTGRQDHGPRCAHYIGVGAGDLTTYKHCPRRILLLYQVSTGQSLY